MRPRLLDLFCGAGGCSVGYDRAGFDVTGVDSEPHPAYPYPIVVADALQVLAAPAFLASFDVIHASPPCQAYSVTSSLHDSDHPELVGPVRDALIAWGGAYVIENVVGAPLINPLLLCGTEFGLGAVCRDGKWRQLRRHRLFESNRWLMGAGSCHHRGEAVGVYGHGGSGNGLMKRRGYQATAAEGRDAMGIDWMKHHDVVQAIPPVYTEYIGQQLMQEILSNRLEMSA